MCFFLKAADRKCMHLDQTRQESKALRILFSYDFFLFLNLSPKMKIHAFPHGNITGWIKFKAR